MTDAMDQIGIDAEHGLMVIDAKMGCRMLSEAMAYLAFVNSLEGMIADPDVDDPEVKLAESMLTLLKKLRNDFYQKVTKKIRRASDDNS